MRRGKALQLHCVSSRYGVAIFACFTASVVAPLPAVAEQLAGTTMELGGTKLAVSPDEMKALSKLGGLVRTRQKGRQDVALAEARRVATSRDARHALATYELEIGNQRGDNAMRGKALDVLMTSQLTQPEKMPGYLAALGQIAYLAGDFDKAAELWSKWTDLVPSNPDALANLAQVRLAQKDSLAAMDLLERAIVMREVSGQKASEVWYRQRLAIAQQSNLGASTAARALVSAHPTPANWRTALVVYRQLATAGSDLEIDILRLMRVTGSLMQADEYHRMAQLLRQSGEPVEAKSVLDEGIKGGVLDAKTSPTREIIAEIERSMAKGRQGKAVPSPATDKAATLVREGMANYLAGRRAESEKAFRSATGDQGSTGYAELALFWLAWIAQQPGASI